MSTYQIIKVAKIVAVGSILIGLGAFSAKAAENKIKDPGFEESPVVEKYPEEGWIRTPHWTVQRSERQPIKDVKVIEDETISHSGKKCLYLESVSLKKTLYANTGVEDVISFGKTYVYTVWAKAHLASSEMYLNIFQYSVDEKGRHIFEKTVCKPPYPTPMFVLTPDWKQYRFEYTPPNENIRIVSPGVQINGGVYIDDVSFVEIKEG